MDCMYLLMCFSLSQVFLECIFAAKAHGELSIPFPFIFYTCFYGAERCTVKFIKWGGNNDKNEALHLLMGHTLNLTALLFNQCRVLLYFHCDYPLSAIYSCFIKTVLMLR